jgi:palmitoyltransferase
MLTSNRVPIKANLFLASQRGELETVRALIESGKATALDRDKDNITPLHWAAINGQMATCRYLLDQGAEVDAVGGDLVATPLQWAAR